MSSTSNKYAYVWCIFGGNNYIAGLLASAFSVKKTQTPYDLVCMHTGDVDTKLLGRSFDKVVEVDYLQYRSKELKTRKQREIYGEWIDKSYTKMNCLGLTEYTKVLFLDADTIIDMNIDHLFDLQAPAATFSSPWGDKYKGTIPLGMYPNNLGDKVNSEMIIESLYGHGVVAIATTLLLEPNKKDLENYKSFLSFNEPFGFTTCNSGFDEQSITYFYSEVKKVNWTHIHQRYNFIPWKTNWLPHGDKPYVYHFFNKMKPWNMRCSEWSDLEIYYRVVKEMVVIGKYKEEELSEYIPYFKEYIKS